MLPKIREPVLYPISPVATAEHAFPVIAPDLTPTTSPVNICAYHRAHGHIHEALLGETAKQTVVILEGMLHEFKGCSLVKGLRKPIARSTHVRTDKNFGRVFVDLCGPKQGGSKGENRYVMIVRDHCSRFRWLYFLRHKSDAAETFRQYLADNRATRFPSDVAIVRSDGVVEYLEGDFGVFVGTTILPKSSPFRTLLSSTA